MGSGRGWARRSAAVFAVVSGMVLAGCAAPAAQIEVPAVPTTIVLALADPIVEPSFLLPDITSRAITADDLMAMLPDGPTTVSVRSNEHLIMASVLDRSDQADDIVRTSRSTGVVALYDRTAGTGHVWIDVLADANSAHSYLVDLTGDIAKGVDGTHEPDVALSHPIEFAVTAGDEAVGLIGTLGDGTTETLIVARVGRLVLFASEVRSDESDQRVAAQYLADGVIESMLEILTGDTIDLTALLEPAYRFQTTLEVASADQRWATETAGTREAGAVDCTVDRTTPRGVVSARVIEIGEDRWLDTTGDGGFVRAGPNATAAEMLVWCPVWPLPINAAGLSELATADDPARHHLNGVDASGYQGDAAGLAAAIGLDPSGLTVETFSFWVADGTDWLIELALIVSGPADGLAPLIGSEFGSVGEVTVSLRHRVFELDAVDAIVAPN